MKMYKIEFIDWCGQVHIKTYKGINLAIKKSFDICGFYKNVKCWCEENGNIIKVILEVKKQS